MAYDISPLVPEVWADDIQDRLDNKLVAKALCNTKVFPAGSKKKGDKIHRPHEGDDPAVVDYTPRTDVAVQDYQVSDDELTLDQSKSTKITQVDPMESVQALWDITDLQKAAHARALAQYIDADLLDVMRTDAANSIDDSLFGGTSGTGIQASNITADNMLKLLSKIKSILRSANARVEKGIFAVLPSTAVEAVEELLIDKGFEIADRTLVNGMKTITVGMNGYEGTVRKIRIFFSNNLKTVSGVRHGVAGVFKATDLAIQDQVTVNRRKESRNRAYNYFATVLYGRGTPANYKAELIDIKFHASA